MKKSTLALCIAGCLFLSACGDNNRNVGLGAPVNQTNGVPAQQAPVVVQQQDSGFGWGSALIGAAAGYMLGSSGSNRTETRIVEREVVNNQAAPVRSNFTPSAAAVAPKAATVVVPKTAEVKPPAPAFSPPAAPKNYPVTVAAPPKVSAPAPVSTPRSSFSFAKSAASSSSGRR